MKKITFRKDYRSAVINYLTAKANLAKATAEEKAAKKACAELFAEMGESYKTSEKTDYVFGTVQVQGVAKAVVYKETVAKGAVDWQAYAMALGGTPEGAEQYRRPDNIRTALDWATDKQAKEIAELN